MIAGEEAVQARIRELVLPAYAPLLYMYRWSLLAAALALIIAVGVGVLAGDALATLVLGVLLSAAGLLVAWARLADPDVRAIVELVTEHDASEAAAWKEATGTSRPCTPNAIRKWLENHPTSPNRASLLLAVGRLDEARQALEAARPETEVDAFDQEITRATVELYAGGRPDLARVSDAWRSLAGGPQREHRRACVALLEAQVAADSGGDPRAALVRARREIGHGTSRPLRSILLRVSAVLLYAVIMASLIVWALLGFA